MKKNGKAVVSGIIFCVVGLLNIQANAVSISPVSYDMFNGTATHGYGTYAYDLKYSGNGDKNSDLAPLSGGLGELTDGIVFDGQPTQPDWAENFVIWEAKTLNNRIDIVFDFGETMRFNEIDAHAFHNIEGCTASIPSLFEYSFSNDGVNFGDTMGFSFTPALYIATWYNANVDGMGRYLKATLTIPENTAHINGLDSFFAVLDEVRFQGQAVPDSGSTFAFLSLVLGCLAMIRRWMGI